MNSTLPRLFLLIVALAHCLMTANETLSAPPESTADTSKRPNFIFILTDDQGYGDLGRHGHPLLQTPNTDRLYDDSVRFDNFYVSPSCSPTRAALLTGMHEFRNGVTHTIQPREQLSKEAVVLPQLLKTAGYATGFIGKWHLGNGSGYAPQDRGFEWTSTNVGGAGIHFDPVFIRNGVRDKRVGYRENLFFDEAMAFIDEHRARPFFCYLSTYSPHTPLAVPEEFIAPYRGAVDEEQATYLGMVANIDFNVGRLLDFLRQRKLEDNTIIIFMNDNGQTIGLDVYNAGMRGCKCTIWEGGSRAMSLWRCPSRWKPHTVDKLTAHFDIFPTLCDLAGVSVPEKLQPQLEGFSLRPLLESAESVPWHEDRILFQHVARWPTGLAASHKYAMCAVRQGNHVLLRSHPCDNPKCTPQVKGNQCHALRRVETGATRAVYTKANAQFHWGVSTSDRWVLFDSKRDPECTQDLAAENPELASTLAAAYDQWWDDVYPVMVRAGGDKGLSSAKTRSAVEPARGEKNSGANDYARQRKEIGALADLKSAPPVSQAEGFQSTKNMKALFIDALNWKGAPTKVFAWLGIPENRQGKVPGVVLVHGGGGTAFKEWVRKWNDQGFAAISIAVEGQSDKRGPVDSQRTSKWQRHAWPGPARDRIYGDSALPLKDQWMYHAVADTILANSLLRSLPEVDAEKVGLMGISWGGVITSTVMGIDDRFAFAIPVYGCGNLSNAENQYGRALGNNKLYKQLWDPIHRLGSAKMPTLWLSWPQDKHFPLDCQAACYRAASGPQMVTLIPGLGHGHGPPWNRPESYAFAKAVTRIGEPWCQQMNTSQTGAEFRAMFSSTKLLENAVLVSTTDSGITGNRKWVESPATLTRTGRGWQVSARLPARATAWFVNVFSGKLVVSSEYFESDL